LAIEAQGTISESVRPAAAEFPDWQRWRLSMSVSEHIETLRAKHQKLEGRLEDEINRPHPDETLVADLKKEKLRIKDELAQLTTH
jgi:hypothetical protein